MVLLRFQFPKINVNWFKGLSSAYEYARVSGLLLISLYLQN